MKIRVACSNCGARYCIDAVHGGKTTQCAQCDRRFALPIPDPKRLLEWAKTARWQDLIRFIDHRGAKGHTSTDIDQFVEIVFQRRIEEEERYRREMSPDGRSRSLEEKKWERIAKRIQNENLLMELQNIASVEFEHLIGDVLSVRDNRVEVVGQTADNGVDIKIFNPKEEFWAIAQCKRYAKGQNVGAAEIREFVGACVICSVKMGFYFTTSDYTKHAKRTARGVPWPIRLFNGHEVVNYIREVQNRLNQIYLTECSGGRQTPPFQRRPETKRFE